LLEFAKELEKLGVDYLAVDSAVEGIALRKEGVKIPILILGYTLPEMIEVASANNLDITISNFDYFTLIRNLNINKKIRVHIKVDTGMSRHGFVENEIKKVLAEISKTKNIEVVGLYTHFAMAKNPSFPAYTKSQIEKFNIWREAFGKAGLKPICHAGATAGTLLYKEAHFDMVRIGISLYGIWPSREAQALYEGKIKLQPVLTWKTIIAEVKKMPKGTKIGYDCSETLEKDSVIAVLPIGYWHGLPRALSSIGHVIVNGQKCKILGRVCMDIIMIDVTDTKNPKVGDEVIIIGQDGKNEISASDIATLLDASAYELVTRINPLIKRIYLDK
jgi:alanine racemase